MASSTEHVICGKRFGGFLEFLKPSQQPRGRDCADAHLAEEEAVAQRRGSPTSMFSQPIGVQRLTRSLERHLNPGPLDTTPWVPSLTQSLS